MVKVWSKEPGGIINGPKPALTLSLELGPLARSTSAALNNLVGNALHYQVPLAFPSPHSTKLREATWWFFLSLLLGNSSPIDCRGELQSFQKRVQKALLSLPGVFSNAFHQGPCGSSTMQGSSQHEMLPMSSSLPSTFFCTWQTLLKLSQKMSIATHPAAEPSLEKQEERRETQPEVADFFSSFTPFHGSRFSWSSVRKCCETRDLFL